MRKRSPVSSPLCQARPLGEYGEPENPQMDLGIKEQGPDPSPTQALVPRWGSGQAEKWHLQTGGSRGCPSRDPEIASQGGTGTVME